ncbi:MAG: gamma-glutamyltransferase [Gammaproteobacteria bacterium]|nr:gamma-glutamyltransferase [Gammaproteobacteria bacterium]NNM01094.1 gamma-glutamyltransferase [Gammaproteobacteria bacterium]
MSAPLRLTLAFLALLLAGSAWAESADRPGVAAIASAHSGATEAGFEVLAAGGNAFDAAVAVSAALAVAEPYSSGFGGGGFWLLHRAEDGFETMVDGRETAPAAATRDMYVGPDGRVNRRASLDGPLAAGIPGMLAGLAHINERYGRLSLARCLAPAIRLARDGVEIGERYHRMVGFRAGVMNQDPTTARIFLDGGQQPQVGWVLRQPELARTLELVAGQGAEVFYRGEIARNLVDGVRAAGGIWTLDDLAGYRVKEREPIRGRYHDMDIVSAPPPSSGGIVLVQALNILERLDLDQADAQTRRHLVVEAMRRAYRDRADYLGDPDFVDVPVARLVDKDYAARRAETVDAGRATPSSSLPGLKGVSASAADAARAARPRGTDTTHFSVLDADGNRVAGTLSINIPFGAAFTPPATGVLLNDEMDDFSAAPLAPNIYGLVGVEANAVGPGKRPLSSMTPTFLTRGDRVAVLGTPGGSRIITMVLLGTLDFYAGNDPASWVALERYHHQYEPDLVQFESTALSEEARADLRRRGHELKELGRRYGNMQAILWDRGETRVRAASDPRGEGTADVRR